MDERKAELERQIAWLIGQSRDGYFTEYLTDLREKLRQDAVTAEYVTDEIARTSRLYTSRMKEAESKAKKTSVEFTIGAGVLGSIGVVFILTAFVIMGMNYMNGLAKGIALYVISLAVLLLSELLLTRKLPGFAAAVSSLGIGGLYLSAILNYLYLKNFNCYVTVASTAVISLLAVLISRKRDSGAMKIVSLLGCYISLYPAGQSFLAVEAGAASDRTARFLAAACVLLLVNLAALFLPVKKHRDAVNMTHMILNTCFSVAFAATAFFRLDGCMPALWYLLGAALEQGLIFYVMEGKKKEETSWTVWNMAVYLCADTVLRMTVCLFYVLAAERSGERYVLWEMHLLTGGFFLSGLLVFFLFRKSVLKWLQYMLFAFQTLIVYGLLMAGREELYWWCLGVVLFVFLLSKALSRVKMLRISELVITLWTACVALYYFQEFRPLSALCFLGAFLLSLAALHEWRSLYEEIFILLLECFVLLRFRNTLTPAVMAGILFLGTAGFNYIGFFRDRYTRWFNYINLGFLGVIYAAAAFCGNNYTYGALLLLGVAFILLMFQERFGMGFRFKNVILVLFVCYMALLWELPAPILKSALLMVAAIGAVAAGFAVKQKSLRITGLSLTLAVCGKMILYDFAAADTFAKMLVFMIVGLIALAISGIYIALEKKIV